MAGERKVPRPFTMHWGSGQIVEEAGYSGEHHEPAIQLMEYADGEAKGTRSIRFCFYDHRGRFQRNPMMLHESELDEMRAALAKAPRLRELLRKLVAD